MQSLPKKLKFNGGRPKPEKRRGRTSMVYILVDPRNKEVRYVGITNNASARYKEHMRMYGGDTRKNAWIQELKDAQLLPEMFLIEQLEDETQWREREVYWIQAYMESGADLLNKDMPAKEVAQEGA